MSELVPMAPQAQKAPALTRVVAGPQELIAYHKEVEGLIKSSLVAGVDYALVPGAKKESLTKAGAERMCIAFGCHPEYSLVDQELDHNFVNKYEKFNKSFTSLGLYRFSYKCRIVRNADSQVIGECIGACSSLESKYISRPRDVENTIAKMAQKRAFVGATLHAFGLSDRFTQDLEDAYGHEGNSGSAGNSEPRPNQTGQTAPAAKTSIFIDTNNPQWRDRLNAAFDKRGVSHNLRDGLLLALHGKEPTTEILDSAIALAMQMVQPQTVEAEIVQEAAPSAEE